MYGIKNFFIQFTSGYVFFIIYDNRTHVLVCRHQCFNSPRALKHIAIGLYFAAYSFL